MPDAIDVAPKKWSNITVLYDDGDYSVISGTFEGDPGRKKDALGVRWNGSDGHDGFPNQGGNPLWHVVPHFMERAILHSILDEVLAGKTENKDEYVEAITKELESLTD